MSAHLSVIIPTYNCKQYVCDAIDSALAQSYKNIEIIVVDDGSIDGTGDLLKSKYGDRIKYFYKSNGGPASARNLGINNSRGEFLAFLDADDLWASDKLECQISVFTENAVLVGGGEKTSNDSQVQVITFEELVLQNRFSNSGVMVRRSALDKVGAFDEHLEFRAIEDWDMWLRLSSVGELLYLNRDLIILRVTENSISAPAQAEKMLRNETAVLKKHLADKTGLYRKALSYRYFCAAWAFSTQGQHGRAFNCMVSCFCSHPLALLEKNKCGLFLKILMNRVCKRGQS